MGDFHKCATCGATYLGTECPSCVGPTVAASALQIQPGQSFHGFEIQELLGRGGMGAVYKARQVALDRALAVKILPPDKAVYEKFESRFGREAKALAALSHSNIVAIHDYGSESGLFFIAMEYVDGGNLREHLRMRKMTVSEAVRIAIQICEALEYAHAEGVVHRDIKPENILLDKKGRVKIADFGLAKLSGPAADSLLLTGTGVCVGTAAYMAPEQMENAKEVDHRADLYSTAVVLYEMLTGERPVGRFDPPSKRGPLPSGLDEIVLKGLSKDPEQRYAQASEFKAALLQTVSTVAATSFSPPVPSRRRLWIAVSIVAIVGLAVAAVLVVPRWRASKPPDVPSRTETPVAKSPPPLCFDNLRTLPAGEPSIFALCFSPDGKVLASGGLGSGVTFWEVPTGVRAAPLELRWVAVSTVCIRSDGKRLAVAGSSGVGATSICLWDLERRKELRRWGDAGASWEPALAFSPDGAYLLVAWSTNAIRRWNVETGEELPSLRGHLQPVSSLAVHPQGLGLASASMDGKIKLWDLTTATEFATLEGHIGEAYSVAFSPNGKLLASGGEDRTVRLWQPESKSEVRRLEGHALAVSAVAFHPDGGLLASAGADRKIVLWDVETGKQLASLAGHKEEIHRIAFSPDGSLLASAGEGSELRLWSRRKD